MNDFLETLADNLLHADWLNFLALIITVIASLRIARTERMFNINKERHEKLIAPLFILLEPNLYKKYDENLMKQAMKIINENISLADGYLLNIRSTYTKQPQNAFMELCTYIDKAYDKSCFKLKLKTRNILYRLSNKQYESKISFFFYLLVFIIEHTIIFIVVSFMLICLLTVAVTITISLFSMASLEAQIALAFLLLIFFFIILRRL